MSDEASHSPGERRRNPVLRALIDELLARVRELNRNASTWSPEERQRAEDELNVVLARVRERATEDATAGEPGAPHRS